MPQLELDFNATTFVLIFSAFWAVVCDWFPGFSNWFDQLSILKKKQIVGAGLFLIVLLAWGAGCLNIITSPYACTLEGFGGIIPLYVLAISAAYGAHGLGRPVK